MKEEIKQLWVSALRSGKHKQGKQRLRSANDEFCCLGVLCDLYAKHQGGNMWHLSIDEYVFNGVSVSYPPSNVVEWSGLPNKSPFVMRHEQPVNLAELNDWGATFEEIADLIEEQL